jgi:hypothetical protein
MTNPRPSALGLLFTLLWLTATAALPVPVTPVFGAHGMVVAGAPAGGRGRVRGSSKPAATPSTPLSRHPSPSASPSPTAPASAASSCCVYYEGQVGQNLRCRRHGRGRLARRHRLQETSRRRSQLRLRFRLRARPWRPRSGPRTKNGAAALRRRCPARPSRSLDRGFRILPKSHEFFAEQEKKLRRGDAEIARLYLPGGQLPAVDSLLAKSDLARTMELLAHARSRRLLPRSRCRRHRRKLRQQGGGVLTLDDLARYQARITEPLAIGFRGYRILASPPPTQGPALFLTVMKALEDETFGGGPLRTPANLDTIGRVLRVVAPLVSRSVGDTPDSRSLVEQLLAPDSVRAIRTQALATKPAGLTAIFPDDNPFYESPWRRRPTSSSPMPPVTSSAPPSRKASISEPASSRLAPASS